MLARTSLSQFRLHSTRAALSYRCYSTPAPASAYESILLSNPLPSVTLITLNRPKALNGSYSLPTALYLYCSPARADEIAQPAISPRASVPLSSPAALNSALFHELNAALDAISTDDAIGAVVITGSAKAFAAGADIKEMKDLTFAKVYKEDFLGHWTKMSGFRKPIVAAVSGYALGGGCELAMMCDITLASPSAVFGQPEINLGVIPGAGGTQRLTHALGKSRAMELVLTGQTFTAAQAASWGLISRVVEEGDVVDEAVKVAGVIASKGAIAVQSGKEAVNASFELGLKDGLHLERRLFHQLFATKDQTIGMVAFAEKKKPTWSNE